MSQQQLAQEIYSAQTTIANWENGQREPDFETVKKLADYFSVTTDYLLGKSESPNPPENTDEDIDELDEVDFAFYSDYKELDDERKDAIRRFTKFIKAEQTKK